MPPSQPERWPPGLFDKLTTQSLKLEQFESALRDGTPVLVRPVVPSDRELLRVGFAKLSDASRYARFMAPISELSEEQIRYLTEIDYVDHFAWAAVRSDRRTEGMGVARYVRIGTEPTVGEAAVTVLDRYQGKGLGTLLLALLAVAARVAGIERFRAYVLEENAPMRDLLDALGAETMYDSPGVLRMDVPLDPHMLPDSPAARVLRAVATRLVSPALTKPPGPSGEGPAIQA
jgi:GNAT superfamily N-acetyltransferase